MYHKKIPNFKSLLYKTQIQIFSLWVFIVITKKMGNDWLMIWWLKATYR